MSLTLTDLEKLQQQNPDLFFELRGGEIVIMSPSDYLSEEVGTELLRLIANWVKPRQLGRVTGSSAGFRMPNGDLLATDVAFVKAEKLRSSPRTYAEIAPDLVVEIKSSTDSLKKTKEKVIQFIELGVSVGIVIDPDKHQVIVYRHNTHPLELGDSDNLTLPDILPGWEIPIKDLWPLVF